MFWDNKDFVFVEKKLLRLHELNRAGQGDGDEAEAIRDAMEFKVRRLSYDEERRLIGLYADLCSGMEGSQAVYHGVDLVGSDVRTFVEAKAAEKDWDNVLSLVRRTPGEDDSWKARMRALAWAALGHKEAAMFFDVKHGGFTPRVAPSVIDVACFSEAT